MTLKFCSPSLRPLKCWSFGPCQVRGRVKRGSRSPCCFTQAVWEGVREYRGRRPRRREHLEPGPRDTREVGQDLCYLKMLNSANC